MYIRVIHLLIYKYILDIVEGSISSSSKGLHKLIKAGSGCNDL